MKQNVGKVDKMIRLSLALIIIGLFLSGKISGLTAVLLGLVAFAMILTSLLGVCPLYMPFGIKTCKVKPSN